MLQGILFPRDIVVSSLQRLGRFCSLIGSVDQRDHCTPSGHSRCLKAEAKQQLIRPPVLPVLEPLPPPIPLPRPPHIHHTVPLSSSLQQDLQPCIFILCNRPVSSFEKLQLYPNNLTHAGRLLTLVTVRCSLSLSPWVSLLPSLPNPSPHPSLLRLWGPDGGTFTLQCLQAQARGCFWDFSPPPALRPARQQPVICLACWASHSPLWGTQQPGIGTNSSLEKTLCHH